MNKMSGTLIPKDKFQSRYDVTERNLRRAAGSNLTCISGVADTPAGFKLNM